MSNADRIKADLTVAMKSGDALKVSVLRMLISALGYKQIDVQRDLTDEDVVVVVQNEAKKRREAIESFEKAGRVESATKEKRELEILQAYMPKLMSEEEVLAELSKMDLPKDFGQAMRVAAPLFKGKADGSLVARLVNEKISQS
ncbi:MAG: hypothetical protein UX80_C0003G0035 [Candidatus Amesbacteria bacterium GW2011_GWA2_47_11b]|uniref:Glutamyl-tRNA amidotransferase n=3 Tax=Candidatus Amesiibacteriota TaxID=1752730 RepID=A0A0G1VJG8_9BACT|nr:MAG: hypothetical protein UX42_C0014G0021 [Microgenomates group bacterium GW2011_GWC1_46_20]KKU58380.1 MAG: hypothetical protein UX80_C0003G0035 [Candidatus Amesbacteria bacterium GW2011_GWA2_47_11b]KKU70200.1 MAG: hypothetical protein UX92_C0003G0020 [Candidatus Amesbacteria bacterium GW2011_GWA1_47_20]KKU83118.1 MAG: hypothetical protein UY11_C0028G0012 [Candidatus Amesbacteria bacterium GW2011_GWC2_47_8]